MARIPKKVAERLTQQLKTFQDVLESAKSRDVNESDTVTIITDMLADLFGFNKYTEVTSEQAIRGTYCDLAVTIEGTIKYLIEVKAIGLTLNDNHLRQAVNYGANHGITWVVLTNGIVWEIYRIKFEKPIKHELVCSTNLLELNHRKSDDLDPLFLLCKEGLDKAAIEEFHAHSQIVNRFIIAALIQSESSLSLIRRELRRISPNSKVSIEEIGELLPDVLKRDVLEGDEADAALKTVKKSAQRTLRKKRKKETSTSSDAETTDSKSDSTEE